MKYAKFYIKTICKVSRNCEGLYVYLRNFFIASNAFISMFCILFLLVVVVFFSFLYLVSLRCQAYSGTLSRLKSPKVALSCLKSP